MSTKTGRASQAGLFLLALLAASASALSACGGGSEGAAATNAAADAGSSPPSSVTPDAGDVGDGGPVDPPPPPCDAAQTAAIQASFAAEAIPNDVGGVAVVKDASCGVRYFTRGASKDVAETALHLIASNTKTYIGSLTLLLVDEGKLSLSDSVTKWIVDTPGGDAVKVEHLLNHTSGIYNYTGDAGYIIGLTLGSKTKYTPRQLLDLAFKQKPAFAPGEAGKWAYSNTNYVMLGMIIESVTGKSLAQALRERILTPIGAQATFFNGSETPVGDIVPGQAFNGQNGATVMDPSASWACGNIVATLGDLVDWTEERGSGSFHSAAMQAAMTKGVPTGVDYIDGKITYGAALMMMDETMLNGNGPAMGHDGSTPGYHNIALHFPKKKATIAVMVDNDKNPSGGGSYVENLLMTVVNPYFGTTPKPKTP